MTKRPGISKKGSKPANKTRKKISSCSKKGPESAKKTKKVEIPKGPKLCCYCNDDVTDFCLRCRWDRRSGSMSDRGQCPRRRCGECTQEFHLHCHPAFMNQVNKHSNVNHRNCKHCQ